MACYEPTNWSLLIDIGSPNDHSHRFSYDEGYLLLICRQKSSLSHDPSLMRIVYLLLKPMIMLKLRKVAWMCLVTRQLAQRLLCHLPSNLQQISWVCALMCSFAIDTFVLITVTILKHAAQLFAFQQVRWHYWSLSAISSHRLQLCFLLRNVCNVMNTLFLPTDRCEYNAHKTVRTTTS